MGGFDGLLGKLLNNGVAQDIGVPRFSDAPAAGVPTTPPSDLGFPEQGDKPVLRVKPPSKFHRLMEFVAPILQGAMYGLGTAQPVHGIGAGGFGPAMGGAFQRTQQHGLEMGLMGHQLAMEEQDRALRRATLENTMRHQGAVEQGILGRLAETQKRTEDAGAWGAPFEADTPDGQRGLFQQHSKTGDIRPVMLPGAAGGVAPGAPPTLGAQTTAPLAPGGVQGAMPALPSDTLLRGALGASQAPAPAAARVSGAVPGPVAPVSGQLTRAKPGKHSPGEVKYDEGIPTGIYGEKDKLYRAGDPALPPELKAALGDALGAHKQAMRDKITVASATGESRGKSFGRNRPVDVLDTFNGNRPIRVSAGEAEDNPDRYITAGSGVPALNKTALIEDIRGAIGRSRDTLKAMGNESFNKAQRGLLAAAMGSPQGQGGQYIESLIRSGLTEQQQDYVIQSFQLKENAMAMRSVLGAGQGSEDLRAAITSTIPSAGTPTKQYGLKQLDAFEAQLNRLARGVPNVPLRGEQSKPAGNKRNDPLGIR